MTSEMLVAILAVVMSLLFRYLPGLSVWYGNLTNPAKESIMGVLLLVIAIVAYAMGCAGFASGFGLTVSCDGSGAISMLKVLLTALVTNQSTFLITKR